jgi:hypothetical protein
VTQVSVRAVLYGEADPAAAVAATPAWRTVLSGLSRSGPAGVLAMLSPDGQADLYAQASAAVAGLLNLDALDVLVGGWRKHRALVAAAQRTQAQPGTTERVELASHRITTTHRPYLDINLNGATVAKVHVDLELTLDVETVVATVSGARLVGIEGGRCTVTAGLGCENVPLVSRQLVFDPHVVLRLGEGILLLSEERRPADALS